MTGLARRPWSLRARIRAWVLGLVLLVWAAVMALAWLETERELSGLLDAQLAQTAALLAAGELEHLERGQMPSAPTVLREFQSRVALQLWHEGRLRLRSADAPAQALSARTEAGFADTEVDGERWRVYTAVRLDQGEPEDVIHVGERVTARRHVLWAGVEATLLPLLLALPVLALAIGWSVHRALRPLRTLGDTVAARRPQALDALPADGVVAEVQPLVTALNGLFERVAEQLASERRFTADAAHELRTPIAAIRMQAQVAQGATTDGERAQALAATLVGCDRATRLVEQLLQLARLEADASAATLSDSARPDSDLAALATECVQALAPTAAVRGQCIVFTPPAVPLPVPMAPALVAVLLRNLLDNALRYSPDQAVVQVQVAPATVDAGALLTVQDSGPGLSEEARARLGERFFRVLGTGQSGSGLGWSIVQRLARLYRLSVEVDRSPSLGGLRVRVRWPAGR